MSTDTAEFYVPEKDVAAFAEGFTEAMTHLRMCYDYDETGPPDATGDCLYRVVGIKPDVDECPPAERDAANGEGG